MTTESEASPESVQVLISKTDRLLTEEQFEKLVKTWNTGDLKESEFENHKTERIKALCAALSGVHPESKYQIQGWLKEVIESRYRKLDCGRELYW